MSWGAVILGGSAVIAGGINYLSADKAAASNQSAANQAANADLTMYSMGREDMAPWRESGANALEQLMGAGGGWDIPEELLASKPRLTDYQDRKKVKKGKGTYVLTDQYKYDKAMEKWQEKVRTQSTRTEGSGGGLIGAGPGEFEESPGYRFTLHLE